MKWIGCCVCLGLCSVWMCIYAVHDSGVEWVIECVVAYQERARKKERKGKSGLREKSIFLLLCDCVFHSSISPLSIHHVTTCILTLSLTHHTIAQQHTITIQPHLHAVLFLSLCVTISALIPHSIKQHNTIQPSNQEHAL